MNGFGLRARELLTEIARSLEMTIYAGAIDHIKRLCAGGADWPSNMQLQAKDEAKRKGGSVAAG